MAGETRTLKMTEPTRRGFYDGSVSREDYANFDVEALRRSLYEARHIPGFFYTSPELYEVEKEKIFFKDWLAVGRVEEFPEPGSFQTYRLFDEPFIIARDKSGTLNAFINRCAHRGVDVATGCGKARAFTCPYHGWAYGLDGQLLGASSMEKAVGFDKKDIRLKPLHLDVWAGWIFITFNEKPQPFSEFIAPYDQQLGFLHQENCRLASKLVAEVGCNWKFPVENLMDNYHSTILHAKSIGPTLSVERFTGEGRVASAFTAFYNAKPMTADGKSRFGKMPWLADRPETFACSAHIAPHMHLFARIDNVHPFLMWPVGVDRVRIEVYQLFPTEWHEDEHFEEKVEDYNKFTLQLVSEDVSVMESLHDAASSRHYQPGRMSEMERGVWNTVNYNLDRVLDTGDPQLYPEEQETAKRAAE